MKTLIYTILLLIASLHCNSQSNQSIEYRTDTNHVKLINKQKLNNLLQSTNSTLNWIIIYTNKCAGTKYVLEDIKKIQEQYLDKMNIILCSSEPYSAIDTMLQVLAKANVKLKTVYIIDSDKYIDKISDNREKGFQFRKDICKSCKKDPIGVPYSIIFDNKGEIVKFGYLSGLDFAKNYFK